MKRGVVFLGVLAILALAGVAVGAAAEDVMPAGLGMQKDRLWRRARLMHAR